MLNVFAAIGLALALEGAAYALFPDGMRRAAAMLFAQGDGDIRTAGAIAFAVGAAIVLTALFVGS